MNKKQQRALQQIIVSRDIEETRIAVMEAGRLAELTMEQARQMVAVGNIYRGRVKKVLPAMQAAFIDIGEEQEAFLYIDEALPPGWKVQNRGAAKPNIRTLVQVGEEKIVQISKEAMGSKSPRLTSEISLPGRMLVYLPSAGLVSLSRKIVDGVKRERLRTWATDSLVEGEGIIIRTMAEDASLEHLQTELDFLRAKWREAVQEAGKKKTPSLLLSADHAVTRLLLDRSEDQMSEVVVDDAVLYHELRAQAKAIHPAMFNKIQFYQGKTSVLDSYGVDKEIEKALYRQVWLKNGGFLVIDQTEAMTVIDVNTGKFTGKSGQQLEDTVTATNVEAAQEIARQLRLRDIGGIVIIDFIDMKQARNQQLVQEALQRELEKDATNSYVMGFTQLGLLEMTRKKVRNNLSSVLTKACITCSGKGRILTEQEVAGRFIREAKALIRTQEAEAIVAAFHPHVYQYVQAEGRRERFMEEWGVMVQFISRETMHPSEYQILHVGKEVDSKRFS
ncbi:Rne/Rng family ribonuclease [Brevibacillus laterosporus]|nr:Rne/Rng family ribonuclease [Brevibacillus laterosporus]TPG71435.1 Rne/Rng family ribonuclease [Brevibacillus laterosporus]TPG72828.1 Rne/Rng family ribonuclease [Brevibacillus laterosporus]